MQITQIRIAGFKSFVDPTDVPVEEGLTGIVGPNGCGKSNLLEALRWAMGASSAKAMRGAEMDDLIFSGSDGRPARETAEVTLVLDNSDRTAPAEFNAADTLEIMRRLKRGVGSTYKLNGRTVRGKDIQLLFADASTGANSPALVRQGQISELIASKPQNRRRILEEAAGIAGLNTRRHEAELKLRAAETNLERLTEVSAEVERQLESLKRQARKARKYKALSDEIQGLEALAAHLRWTEAKTAQEQARKAHSDANTAVADLTTADAKAETERLAAANALPPLREAESLASAKLGQARISLARFETERKAITDTIAALEEELERITADLVREQETAEDAKAAAARTEAELASLPSENSDASAEQEAETRARLEETRTDLRDAQARVDTLSTQLTQLQAHRQAAAETLDAQQQREARLKGDVRTLTETLEGIEDLDVLMAALAKAEQVEADRELDLHTADRASDDAEHALKQAVSDENEARLPVETQRTAIRALEGEIAGLKRLLRTAREHAAPPVLEQIKVTEGFEKAIAAALGDDLQASTDTSAPVYWGGS
ncbi:MAG: AAA family ATPase, partial [Pseudomonadota bacterium]